MKHENCIQVHIHQTHTHKHDILAPGTWVELVGFGLTYSHILSISVGCNSHHTFCVHWFTERRNDSKASYLWLILQHESSMLRNKAPNSHLGVEFIVKVVGIGIIEY
jgi:hypothetical protein